MPATETSAYLPRVLDLELDALADLPAIAVTGARAVGKTVTAARRARTIHRLADPGAFDVVAADPRRLLAGAPPILIDEWQRLPMSWDLVRTAVDDDPSSRFLLTGSASPIDRPVHSGAGRIVNLQMRPMALSERLLEKPTVSLRKLLDGGSPPIEGETEFALEQYADEIVRSGFPGLRRLSGRQARAQLDGYVDQLLEHDFEALGGVRIRNPMLLRDWLRAYAAATSTTASRETVRGATGRGGEMPSRPTVDVYDDALRRLWLVDPVPAWLPTPNRLSRLAMPRKHHLVDPALAARLLGVTADGLLGGARADGPSRDPGILLAALFESLVTLSVRTLAQAAEARVAHLRTKGGEHEIDLIVERDDGRILAIEIKLVATVDDRAVRHLSWLARQPGPPPLDRVVVTAGRAAYRRPDGIAVIPAILLGP